MESKNGWEFKDVKNILRFFRKELYLSDNDVRQMLHEIDNEDENEDEKEENIITITAADLKQ